MNEFVSEFNSIWGPRLSPETRKERFDAYVHTAKTTSWYHAIQSDALEIPRQYEKFTDIFRVIRDYEVRVGYLSIEHVVSMTNDDRATSTFNELLESQDDFVRKQLTRVQPVLMVIDRESGEPGGFQNRPYLYFQDGSEVYGSCGVPFRFQRDGPAIKSPYFRMYYAGGILNGPGNRAAMAFANGAKFFDVISDDNTDLFVHFPMSQDKVSATIPKKENRVQLIGPGYKQTVPACATFELEKYPILPSGITRFNTLGQMTAVDNRNGVILRYPFRTVEYGTRVRRTISGHEYESFSKYGVTVSGTGTDDNETMTIRKPLSDAAAAAEPEPMIPVVVSAVMTLALVVGGAMMFLVVPLPEPIF